MEQLTRIKTLRGIVDAISSILQAPQAAQTGEPILATGEGASPGTVSESGAAGEERSPPLPPDGCRCPLSQPGES